MKKPVYLASCCFVHCVLALQIQVLCAQTIDSSKRITFDDKKNAEPEKSKQSKLQGIVSGNIGSYNAFRIDGHYGSFLQPNIGFEFLAEPGGSLQLLLGGHIGISDPLTTGVAFGVRLPINASRNPNLQIFSDIGILAFDDGRRNGPIGTGLRMAFGARTTGPVDLEYRLAGEWRGSYSDSIDGARTRQLWWVGAEFGIAFSLVGESRQMTRKDSLRASLHYIATRDELDDLEAISSEQKLDQWIERFWRMRDLTPETRLNEARIEYENRTETANRLFSTSKRLGVLSDPGRVIAIYGLPDFEDEDHSAFDERVRYRLFVYKGRISGVSFGIFLFETSGYRPAWSQIYSNVAGEMTGLVPSGLAPRMLAWIQ